MRILRRVLLFFLIAFVLLWFFRGVAFRSLVRYKITGQRAPVSALPPAPTSHFALEKAMELALDSTAARLQFSSGRVSNDPRILMKGGPANCIGYAALCAALLKGQLEVAGLSERYSVEAVISKLYIGDLDLHTFFSSPFWKDHDVVRVVDVASGDVTLLDPTLYDAIGVGHVMSVDTRTLTTYE